MGGTGGGGIVPAPRDRCNRQDMHAAPADGTLPVMPLAWNQIRPAAAAFAREWADASKENAEAQTFWNEFFAAFGVKRRSVAAFEEPVKDLAGGSGGRIDLFWPGTLLAEHKSRGKDLGRATSQAFDYCARLAAEGRVDELPRYVVVTDFARVALHDRDAVNPDGSAAAPLEFPLSELPDRARAFAFVAGYRTEPLAEQDPVNVKAVRLMGDLHAALAAGGYAGPDLERLLVRVLFCLFAEDTGIFDQPDAFRLHVENHTAPDGHDLGGALHQFFEVLDTPPGRRQKNLPEDLAALPYVNGELFAGRLSVGAFDRDMRNALLAAARLQWKDISPAVFGSMFQTVMAADGRREEGAHYTTERDILKVVRGLFLDRLEAELADAGADRRKLAAFRRRLRAVKLLDPACGCGNFLVVAYRELRRLEIEALRTETGATGERGLFDLNTALQVNVDQMYGIELGEWPARIARAALWLTDHQMNQEAADAFGEPLVRLPLTSTPHVVRGNALKLDWADVLPPGECAHVLGNPPFVGGKYQSKEQKADLKDVARGVKSAGLLDYVCGWYLKAADYLREADAARPANAPRCTAAFVSTNSITQGEQVGVLWGELFRRGVHLHFAHRTFAWTSEAAGKAHVHCVIVGFGLTDRRPGDEPKRLTDYATPKGAPVTADVPGVSPYLVAGGRTVVTNRSTPLCAGVPKIGIGNKPIDGGHYLFTPEEKAEFLDREPGAAGYFRRWLGSREYLQGIERWCLWVGDAEPDELRKLPAVMERVRAVRETRAASKSPPTQKLAETPRRFHVENMPDSDYLLIPKVSSERREYVPMGRIPPDVLSSDLVFVVPDATLYHFGILTTAMHMAWLAAVCGRLESRYRYSAKLVYNNFPWPDTTGERANGRTGERANGRTGERAKIEALAQTVLDARAAHPGATPADLYDPDAMPRDLRSAHAALDRAVDRLYRREPFADARERAEFLLTRYEALTAPLAPKRRARR